MVPDAAMLVLTLTLLAFDAAQEGPSPQDGVSRRERGKRKVGDALDVIGLGKHIYRLHLLQLEAIITEDTQVARQGGRVAGNVHDLGRLAGSQRLQHGPVASRPRRVQEDRIRVQGETGEDNLYFAFHYLYVWRAGRVLPRISYRRARLFHCDDACEVIGEKDGESAYAGVGIDQEGAWRWSMGALARAPFDGAQGKLRQECLG